jgi:hypothetical protein
MYFKDPVKSLIDVLHLITSDDDLLFLSSCHIGHYIVHLYILSFGERGGDEDDNEDDYKARVDLHDPWWVDKFNEMKICSMFMWMEVVVVVGLDPPV